MYLGSVCLCWTKTNKIGPCLTLGKGVDFLYSFNPFLITVSAVDLYNLQTWSAISKKILILWDYERYVKWAVYMVPAPEVKRNMVKC